MSEQTGGTTKTALIAIPVLLIVGAICLSVWQRRAVGEAEAYDGISGMVDASSPDIEELVRQCQQYVEEYPRGKNVQQVKSTLARAEQALSRREEVLAFETAARRALAGSNAALTRERLMEKLEQDTATHEDLLLLAFLAYGVDQWDAEAADQADSYRKLALEAGANSAVCAAIKENIRLLHESLAHNRRPKAPQAGVSSVTATADGYHVPGLALNGGSTAHYSEDGALESVVDSAGTTVWRLRDDPMFGAVWTDAQGVDHYGAIGGLMPVAPLLDPEQQVAEVVSPALAAASRIDGW